MNNSKMIGYGAALLATVLLATVGIFVRNISTNVYVITLARVGMGLVFLLIYMLFKGELKHVQATKPSFYIIATGVLLAGACICYINAIKTTSLANAVFLLYLGPLLAVGLAAVILKEKFTPLNGVLLGLAFLGFLFLIEFKFSFDMSESKGLLWGIASGLCYAFYIICNRSISTKVPALTRSFYQLLFATISLIPFLDGSMYSIIKSDILWLIAIGFFHGFLAFTCIAIALKHLKAVEYGTISYVEPIVASIIGFTIYSESITVLQFIGCAIVFTGGMIQILATNQTVAKA